MGGYIQVNSSLFRTRHELTKVLYKNKNASQYIGDKKKKEKHCSDKQHNHNIHFK